jgi:hypothetical protein
MKEIVRKVESTWITLESSESLTGGIGDFCFKEER